MKKTDRKIAIFIVAYNAAETLIKVIERIPEEIMDIIAEIFVFDDHSTDETFSTGTEYKTDKDLDKLNNLTIKFLFSHFQFQ